MIDSDNSPFNVSRLHLSAWLTSDQVVQLARSDSATAVRSGARGRSQPWVANRTWCNVCSRRFSVKASMIDQVVAKAVDEVVNGVDRHIPDLMRLVAGDQDLLELTKRIVSADISYDGADPSHAFSLVSGISGLEEGRLRIATELYKKSLTLLHERGLASALAEAPAVARKCDVLLVTATDIETAAVRDVFADGEPFARGSNVYRDLGSYGDSRVVLVRSAQMGAGGSGGAILTVSDAIDHVRPSAVIVVGIAFGMKPGQRLADVLCATQVIDSGLPGWNRPRGSGKRPPARINCGGQPKAFVAHSGCSDRPRHRALRTAPVGRQAHRQ